MARDFSEVLQQAMEFYVAGHLVEARALLLDVVRANPKMEAGWMFLSYTIEDPNQKSDCLRKVLAINPQNSEAKTALEKLEAEHGIKPRKPPSTNELIHASPFTVDIDHANDDIPFMEKKEESEAGSQPIGSKPFITQPLVQTPIAGTALQPLPGPDSKPVSPLVPQPASVRPLTPQPQSPVIQKVEKPVTADLAPKPEPAHSVPKPVPVSIPGKPVPPKSEGQEPAIPKKRRGFGCTCLTITAVISLMAVLAGVGLWATGNLPAGLFPTSVPQSPATTLTITTPAPVFTLPPQWTDTLTPTITLTATITPTPTQTYTASFVPPDATVQANMDKLKKQVEDLRGLTMNVTLPVYVVTTSQAETVLEAELDRIGYRETIQNEAKALVALGYIKPTYDLAKYALSRLADGVLGFYMPSYKSIYIIGNRFAGMEKWIFSHEYDHALVHNYFPAVGIMEDDPVCTNDSQRCEAIRALVEGDAVLLMVQWYLQYATAYDIRDIGLYRVPFGLAPEDNTPPYIGPIVNFPYDYGYAFVAAFHELGNWARVNKIYDDLPVSTEQIMHPEKYLSGEKPIALEVPDLQTALGDSWTLIESDSLGEYMTFLLLAYGADNLAQITLDKAEAASAGWGGDHYVVYASSENDQTVLAAEWVWDQEKDATEFLSRMEEHVDLRFRGGKLDSSAGDCWAMNEQTTCIFHVGKKTLWVLGPDLDSIEQVRTAYKIY